MINIYLNIMSDQETMQPHVESVSDVKSEEPLVEPPVEQVPCDVTAHDEQHSTPCEDTLSPSDSVLINGADLTPVGGEPESVLDDDPLSELSQKFVDALDLPMNNPELVRANAQCDEQAVPEPCAEDVKKFNESMVMISAYAEDVVKTWFSQIYNRALYDVFPDGLTGNIGSVTMLPSEDMIRARRRARVGHDEEVRDGDIHEDDSAGWELRLAVVDGDHRTNLDEWKLKEPVVLQHMQGLLKMAWGYIHYAIESYDLPDKELFVNQVYPSPWGTLYVHGAPDTVPQIGITLTRIHAKSKSE